MLFPTLKKGYLLLFLVILLSGCNYDKERPDALKSNEIGNTMNNILNGGYVTSQGDWIFYAEPEDHSYIYTKTKDGEHKQILVRQSAGFINVLGDQLFYQNKSDGSKLYKSLITGENNTRITDEEVGLIIAEADWIYFVDSHQRINRIRHNGSEQELLTKTPVNSYMVSSDVVYFVEPLGHTVSSLDLKTEQLSELASVPHTIVKVLYTEKGLIYLAEEDKAVYEVQYSNPKISKLINHAEDIFYDNEKEIYYFDKHMRKYNKTTGESFPLRDDDNKYYGMQWTDGSWFYMDHPNPALRKIEEINFN